MPQALYFADVSSQLHARAGGVKRPICRVRVALQHFAIMTLCAVCALPAFAASKPALITGSDSLAIKVGQQQSGQPLRLHGVFEAFNPSTRRLKLTRLDWFEVSWEDTVGDVEVDDGVITTALQPGMAVTATLIRRPNGKYYVSGLTKG